jgi:hypothetical protein
LQITSGSSFVTPLVNETITTPASWFKALQPGTMYSWRVMAQNDHVGSPWSDTARFITIPQTTTALVPLWPKIASEDEPLDGTCRFTGAAEFEHYDVQFSRTPAFDSNDYSFTTNTTTVEYASLKHDTSGVLLVCTKTVLRRWERSRSLPRSAKLPAWKTRKILTW